MAMKMMDEAERNMDAQPMTDDNVTQARLISREEQERIWGAAEMFGVDGPAVFDCISQAQRVENEDGSFSWQLPSGHSDDVVEFADAVLHYATRSDGSLNISNGTIANVVHDYIIPGPDEERPALGNSELPISIDPRTEQRIRQEAERRGLNADNVLNIYRTTTVLAALDSRLGSNLSSSVREGGIGVGGEYNDQEIALGTELAGNNRTRGAGARAQVYIENRDFADVGRRHARREAVEREEQELDAAHAEAREINRDDFAENSVGELVWDNIRAQGRNPEQVMNIMRDVSTVMGDHPIAEIREAHAHLVQDNGWEMRNFDLAIGMIREAEEIYDVSQFSDGRATLVSLLTGSQEGVTPEDLQRFRAQEHTLIARLEGSDQSGGRRVASAR